MMKRILLVQWWGLMKMLFLTILLVMIYSMFPLKLASSQVNTKASAGLAVGLAKEIFGPELPTPLPHQVGSTPGGVKSPPLTIHLK